MIEPSNFAPAKAGEPVFGNKFGAALLKGSVKPISVALAKDFEPSRPSIKAFKPAASNGTVPVNLSTL